MQKPNLTYDSDEFIIKNTNSQHLIGAIISSGFIFYLVVGPYDKTRIIFKENFIVAVIFTIAIISFAIYCWFKLFDKSAKFIVNKKGIWANKIGFIKWDSIQYYYFGQLEGDIIIYLLKIKLHNSEKEIQIDISFIDKSRNELTSAIQLHSARHKIFNLSDDQYK